MHRYCGWTGGLHDYGNCYIMMFPRHETATKHAITTGHMNARLARLMPSWLRRYTCVPAEQRTTASKPLAEDNPLGSQSTFDSTAAVPHIKYKVQEADLSKLTQNRPWPVTQDSTQASTFALYQHMTYSYLLPGSLAGWHR